MQRGMDLRQLRRARKRRTPEDLLGPRPIRPSGHSPPDINVRYDESVVETVRRVNRKEWARIIRELVAEVGSQRALARLIGVSERAIHRWLTEEVAVSRANVELVASKTGRNAVALLARVGYFTAAEARRLNSTTAGPPETAPAALASDQEWIADLLALVRRSKLSREQKAELIVELLEEEETQEQQRIAERDALRQKLMERIERLT